MRQCRAPGPGPGASIPGWPPFRGWGHRSRSPLWPLGPHGQRPAPRVVLDPPSPERLQPVSSEACPRVGTVALNKARAATQGIHMQLTLLTSPRNHPRSRGLRHLQAAGQRGLGGCRGFGARPLTWPLWPPVLPSGSAISAAATETCSFVVNCFFNQNVFILK